MGDSSRGHASLTRQLVQALNLRTRIARDRWEGRELRRSGGVGTDTEGNV